MRKITIKCDKCKKVVKEEKVIRLTVNNSDFQRERVDDYCSKVCLIESIKDMNISRFQVDIK